MYKYSFLRNVDPNLLVVELNKAGICDWKLIHVQPVQTITPGLSINNQPVVKLTYDLIFIKETND